MPLQELVHPIPPLVAPILLCASPTNNSITFHLWHLRDASTGASCSITRRCSKKGPFHGSPLVAHNQPTCVCPPATGLHPAGALPLPRVCPPACRSLSGRGPSIPPMVGWLLPCTPCAFSKRPLGKKTVSRVILSTGICLSKKLVLVNMHGFFFFRIC